MTMTHNGPDNGAAADTAAPPTPSEPPPESDQPTEPDQPTESDQPPGSDQLTESEPSAGSDGGTDSGYRTDDPARDPTGDPADDAADGGAGGAASTTPDAPAAPGRARLALTTTALLLMVAAAGLDLALIATALPTIVGELTGLADLSWVITAYLVAATVVIPVYGRIGARLGRRTMFVVAILLFIAGAVLAGQAGTMTELIGFRALQGAGAGGLVIGAHAIVTELVPSENRGRYIGWFGVVFGLATVGGAPLGGVLTDQLSWRWCLYVMAPIGVLALLLTLFAPRIPAHTDRPKLDLLGSLFLGGVAAGAVVLAAWAGTTYAWTDPLILGVAGGTVALLALFVLAERLSSDPVLPLRLFANSVFVVASLVGMLAGAAMAGAIAFLPTYLQVVGGVDATTAGVLLLPLVAGGFVGAILAGRIAAATGHYKFFPIAGMASGAAGMYLVARLGSAPDDVDTGLAFGILGLGIGLVLPVLVVAVGNAARPGDGGIATSATNYLRQIGACIGVAAGGALFLDRLFDQVSAADVDGLAPAAAAGNDVAVQAFADAVPGALWYGVPVLAAGFVLALFLRQVRPEEPAPTSDHEDLEPDEAVETEPTAEPTATQNGFLTVDDIEALRSQVPDQRLADERAIDSRFAPPDIATDDQIRVFVHQDDGAAIKGAVLTLIDAHGNQAGRSQAAGGGVYLIPTPSKGSYVLIGRADNHQPRATNIEVDHGPIDVELVLGGESGLGGVIYGPDGDTVESATVTLSDSQGSVVASRQTDADGEYDFDELMPGSYTLTVNCPTLQPAAQTIRVPETGRIRQDVRLAGGADIYGVARTQVDQRPIPDARVTLLDPNGHVLAVTTTDGRGHYEFSNMTEGEYTVVASCYPPAASTVVVAGTQAVEHDVELGYPDQA